MSARAAAAGFTGFADANARFFRALAKNQNREWFLAHKDEYERGWLEPMKALLTELRYTLEPSYPCELGEPKVFRIFRDVRFSHDKSPYKTQVAGYVPLAGLGGRQPGPVAVYLHLGIETYVGAGAWSMEPPQLDRFRAALLDDRRGGELVKLLAKLEKAGFAAGSHDALKKVPRGIDPGHLVQWLVKQSKRAVPVVEWLARMGETSSRPSSARRSPTASGP